MQYGLSSFEQKPVISKTAIALWMSYSLGNLYFLMIYLRNWQLDPVHDIAQEHVYVFEFVFTLQMPPFRHGFCAHTFTISQWLPVYPALLSYIILNHILLTQENHSSSNELKNIKNSFETYLNVRKQIQYTFWLFFSKVHNPLLKQGFDKHGWLFCESRAVFDILFWQRLPI